MEYQNIINLLDNTTNQPSKFWTRNRVEINNESRGTCSTHSQIEFETSMIILSLCDYSDAYIRLKVTITIPNTGTAAALNSVGEKVIFNNNITVLYLPVA